MLPEVLVFHLKRFSYSRYSKNKLDSFVTFPIHDLDLSKYVKSKDGKPYLYELYAISNHYGGLGGGHYTAYAKVWQNSSVCYQVTFFSFMNLKLVWYLSMSWYNLFLFTIK